ncbi:hypothetical protein Tco_1577773 [Tanacetum coccineum]
MERGFLTASNSKINNNTNNLAARVRNIDGTKLPVKSILKKTQTKPVLVDGVVKDSTKAGVEGNVLRGECTDCTSTSAVKVSWGLAVTSCMKSQKSCIELINTQEGFVKAAGNQQKQGMTNTNQISFSTILQGNQQKKVVKIKELHNEEVVEGAAVAIPIDVVEEVSNKFTNTLFGHFIGKHVAFPRVKKYVENTWAKYGLQHVMLQKGFFFFQFSTKKGRPIMIDAYTSEMCVNPWGRSTYARALIEVSAAKALMDSLVMAIPLPNGKGHTLETIDIEYEWKPPRCENCNGDSSKRVPNKGTADTPQVSGELKTPTSNTFDVLNVVNEEEHVVSNPNRNEEGNNDPQGKVEGSVQTGVKKSTEAHVETIGLSSKVTNERGLPVSKNDYASTSYPASTTWECINESDIDDDNYGSSLGGGYQLEDKDLDFSDGYEDQVFDLPGELKNFRDFKLNMSGRK